MTRLRDAEHLPADGHRALADLQNRTGTAKSKGSPHRGATERCGEMEGRAESPVCRIVYLNERSPREEPHRTMHPVHRGPERQTKPDMAILLFRERDFRCKRPEAPQDKMSRM